MRYGQTSTYLHKLNEDLSYWLCNQTNRSKTQTLYLYQLVDGNFEKLVALEEQIKNTHYHACPDNKQDVDFIMKMKPKTKWFKIELNEIFKSTL